MFCMTRVETYHGTPEELADFVGSVWAESYAGKMVFPHWTAEYFRWQFRWIDRQAPDYLLAAYDGDRLAGVLLGTAFTFRTHAEVLPGAQWSWLSIHHDYRGQGITKALNEERIARHRAHQAPLCVSFRFFGSKHSQAEQLRENTPHKRFHRKIGNWARVIDAERFARWTYSSLEGLAARCTVPLAPRVRGIAPENSIRQFAADDLDACLKLLKQSQSKASLWIDWTRDQLAHQLGGSPVSQTLVLQDGESIDGLINFHILPMQAKTVENVAIIDLIAFGPVSIARQTQLLRTAISRMAEQQAILVIKPRLGETPLWPLLRLWFAPQPDSSYLVFQALLDLSRRFLLVPCTFSGGSISQDSHNERFTREHHVTVDETDSEVGHRRNNPHCLQVQIRPAGTQVCGVGTPSTRMAAQSYFAVQGH